MLAQVPSQLLEVASQGGTLGFQAIVLAAVGALARVIIVLDRRREAIRAGEEVNRTAERANARSEFDLLVTHHKETIKEFSVERANIQTERQIMTKTLIDILSENHKAFSGLEKAINGIIEKVPKVSL